MMKLASEISIQPAVHFVGDLDHPDFRDAIQLVRREARIVAPDDRTTELIIAVQSRPGEISSGQLEWLRRAAPLAGIVGLLGSWCEGETRTGQPWPGIQRLYWYEFPSWWQRQILLRAAGRCPDWARPANFGLRVSDCGLSIGEPGRPRSGPGLIVLRTARRETADALADVFNPAGYSTAWQPPGRPRSLIRGAVVGIWDGAQLGDREAADLAGFCEQMTHDGAPVLALLDFPRRDRVDHALEIGAAAILGKPWLNADLIAMLATIIELPRHARAA